MEGTEAQSHAAGSQAIHYLDNDKAWRCAGILSRRRGRVWPRCFHRAAESATLVESAQEESEGTDGPDSPIACLVCAARKRLGESAWFAKALGRDRLG